MTTVRVLAQGSFLFTRLLASYFGKVHNFWLVCVMLQFHAFISRLLLGTSGLFVLARPEGTHCGVGQEPLGRERFLQFHSFVSRLFL
jgi:hypothetical protein